MAMLTRGAAQGAIALTKEVVFIESATADTDIFGESFYLRLQPS
jgi:hypothetical protein